jgi:RimJ/RimL family protein N-acetyltransferase
VNSETEPPILPDMGGSRAILFAMSNRNDFGQPIGEDLGGWVPPPMIPDAVLNGRHVRLRRLTVDDAETVYATLGQVRQDLWTYMPFGPFYSVEDASDYFTYMVDQPDWRPYIIEVDGLVQGFNSYLRINPHDGVIEIGSIVFAPQIQRTTAATESVYLMMLHAFDSGYRRVEWKCDSLHSVSRRAAKRLGFRYEGTFVNATHYKGRSRDTAWFAVTMEEWPDRRQSLEAWLDPTNFDQNGHQLRPLSDLDETD